MQNKGEFFSDFDVRKYRTLYLCLLPLNLNGKSQRRIWKKVRRERGGGADQRLVTVTERWRRSGRRRRRRQKEEKKKEAYSGDILCGAGMCLVLTYTDTHTHTHTQIETPIGLKIGQKNISLLERKIINYDIKLAQWSQWVAVVQQRNVLKQKRGAVWTEWRLVGRKDSRGER